MRLQELAQPEQLGHAILCRVATKAILPFGATSFCETSVSGPLADILRCRHSGSAACPLSAIPDIRPSWVQPGQSPKCAAASTRQGPAAAQSKTKIRKATNYRRRNFKVACWDDGTAQRGINLKKSEELQRVLPFRAIESPLGAPFQNCKSLPVIVTGRKLFIGTEA